MPFFDEIKYENITIFFWKIEESSEKLYKDITLSFKDLSIYQSIKIEKKRLEFLAIRYLLKKAKISSEYLFYNENGKPYLSNGFSVSITHSFPFVALAIGNKELGIDIEKCTPRILKLTSRFTDWQPLSSLDEELKILAFTQIWTIKEALFKVANATEVDFKNNLIINEFQPNSQQQTATIIYKNSKKEYNIYSHFLENFVWSLAY
ncbi:MAG: 4'-phosphopantetheinyl transferase superfamily protein [Capnocytophaga sp.]|nr:4'-phosphopantetheinyl transferase superfamily protein [Capnocytophaga sp.]